MTASIAAQRAVGLADHRDAAAAVGDHDEAGVDQCLHGRRVEDLAAAPARRPPAASPSRRGPPTSRRARPAAPPRRPARNRPIGLVGLVNPGSSASTRVRVTSVAVRRSSPRVASAASSAFIRTKPSVACVCAPHQSSGTGGTTAAASSFLTSRLPTCGPLPWVITTSTSCSSSSATASIATSAAAIWSSGRARPSALVMALPPSASRTLIGRCPRVAGRSTVQRARISSASSGAGPSTGTPGATSWTGSGRTGPGGTPHSASQSPSWADETAYTIRPSPIQPCAAAHIGQCSPEV